MSNNFEAGVLQTIRYFNFFEYPPNFEEIYTFLEKKSSKKHLASILENMAKKKVIKRSENGNLYTLPQYSIYFKNRLVRQLISKKKLQKVQLFLKILSYFPQIQLIGLSGTVAMMNAEGKDDIDIFIISARKRLWTARMMSLIIAQMFGLRRKAGNIHTKDKVCLNLFFDESNLKVPKFKQTEYVAHEILQMKPLINKSGVYEKFLAANRWVLRIFPNARQIFNLKFSIFNQNSIFNFQLLKFIGDLFEFFLKKLQLISIKQHQTSEIVTDSQLWFFPQDFEKKILKQYR